MKKIHFQSQITLWVFVLCFVLVSPAVLAQTQCGDNATDIGGTIWRDFNLNGVQDSGEPGFGTTGMIVTAYNVSNSAVMTANVQNDGTYLFPMLADSNPYRLEVSGLPNDLEFGAAGGDSGTGTMFVNGATCEADVGVNNPVDYCGSDADMKVATACYVNGLPDASDALVSYPYTSTSTDGTPGAHALLATTAQVGSIWGLASDASTQRLFTAAFVKRHTGMGPNGSGAIYVTDVSSGTANATLFATIPNANTSDDGIAVPSNTDRLLTTNKTAPTLDPVVYDLVGKTGLGDMDISADGLTLYVMNLGDRQLYSVDTATGTSVTPLGRPSLSCTNGVARPFATKEFNGLVYTGWVCTQEDSNITVFSDLSQLADLSAHVYTYDPVGNTWSATSILDIPLDYRRGNAAGGNIVLKQ